MTFQTPNTPCGIHTNRTKFSPRTTERDRSFRLHTLQYLGGEFKKVLPSSNHWASPVSSLSCQSSRLPCCCVCGVHSRAPLCQSAYSNRDSSLGRLTLENTTAPVTHVGLRGLTGLHLTPCVRAEQWLTDWLWLCVRRASETLPSHTHSLVGAAPPRASYPSLPLQPAVTTLRFALSIRGWLFWCYTSCFDEQVRFPWTVTPHLAVTTCWVETLMGQPKCFASLSGTAAFLVNEITQHSRVQSLGPLTASLSGLGGLNTGSALLPAQFTQWHHVSRTVIDNSVSFTQHLHLQHEAQSLQRRGLINNYFHLWFKPLINVFKDGLMAFVISC